MEHNAEETFAWSFTPLIIGSDEQTLKEISTVILLRKKCILQKSQLTQAGGIFL